MSSLLKLQRVVLVEVVGAFKYVLFFYRRKFDIIVVGWTTRSEVY